MQVRNAQIARQGRDRAAISVDGGEKQGLLLMPVVTLFELFERLAHRVQGRRESLYIVEDNDVFEIAHDFMPIQDRVHIAERPMEKRSEVVFALPYGNRRDNLIKIQVDKKVGRSQGFARAGGLPRYGTICCGTSWEDLSPFASDARNGWSERAWRPISSIRTTVLKLRPMSPPLLEHIVRKSSEGDARCGVGASLQMSPEVEKGRWRWRSARVAGGAANLRFCGKDPCVRRSHQRDARLRRL